VRSSAKLCTSHSSGLGKAVGAEGWPASELLFCGQQKGRCLFREGCSSPASPGPLGSGSHRQTLGWWELAALCLGHGWALCLYRLHAAARGGGGTAGLPPTRLPRHGHSEPPAPDPLVPLPANSDAEEERRGEPELLVGSRAPRLGHLQPPNCTPPSSPGSEQLVGSRAPHLGHLYPPQVVPHQAAQALSSW